MRDFTRLSEKDLCEELRSFALFNQGRASDLCFAASIRLKSYAERISELEERLKREEDDGK